MDDKFKEMCDVVEEHMIRIELHVLKHGGYSGKSKKKVNPKFRIILRRNGQILSDICQAASQTLDNLAQLSMDELKRKGILTHDDL